MTASIGSPVLWIGFIAFILLTIALDQRSAAQELKLRAGTTVTIAMESRS